MSWNVAFNMFMDIKQAYIDKFGDEAIWDYSNSSCIEYWCSCLNDNTFNDMIRPLQFTEYKHYLLMKYNNLSDTFEYDEETGDNLFWSKYNSLYRECRSVVVDITNERLVLAPFKKFFNVNELPETNINLIKDKIIAGRSYTISDKMDGSMQSYRFYNGEIIGSGSQALDRSKSFRLERGYEYITSSYYKMMYDHPNYTFIFEFIDDQDSHIVEYDKSMNGLYLIGVRDVRSGYEFDYAFVAEMAEDYDVKHTKMFFDMTFDDMLASISKNEKKANEAEGFVLEIDDTRYKIKYDDYVNLHKLYRAASSPNVCLQAVRDGRVDDFLAKVHANLRPKVENIVYDILKYIEIRETQTKFFYDKVYNITQDKKSFMIKVGEIVPREYQGPVKNLYNDKATDFLKGIKYYQIEDFLKN